MFMVIVFGVLTLGFMVLFVTSAIKMSSEYERHIQEQESLMDSEIEMVDLSDISEENNTDDENIEEWAEKNYDKFSRVQVMPIDEIKKAIEYSKKSKDEKYLEDISESMPEEVVENAKIELSEQEIGYLEEDVEAVEKLYDEIDFIEAAEDIPDEDDKFADYVANYQYLDSIDISLQTMMQYYAEQYDVPYSLVLALVETESSFREDIGTEKVLGGAKGGPRYYGYMQLSNQNCVNAAIEGIDAHTPEGNIEWGCKLLRRYYDKYESWESAIMCYKHGEGGAEPFIKNGKVSTPCKNVMEKRSKWLDILYECND